MIIERQTELKLLNIAYAAAEHVFFIGPPGTAKSLTVQKWAEASEKSFFRVLMTRFTTPDEVFGPISIPDLQQGRVVRNTEGFLPSAEIAFLDETFKASSSILNALLTIMEERIYFQNGTPTPARTRTVVGASNELPEEDGLEALYDRFLFRHEVAPVKDRMALLRLAAGQTVGHPVVAAQEVDIERVSISDNILNTIADLAARIEREIGIKISDRRLVKSVKAVRAAAALDGADEVENRHLWVLSHIFVRTPGDYRVSDLVFEAARPYLAEARRLVREAEQQFAEIDPNKPDALLAWAKATTTIKKRLEELANKDEEVNSIAEAFTVFRQQQLARAIEA